MSQLVLKFDYTKFMDHNVKLNVLNDLYEKTTSDVISFWNFQSQGE
jgi:hypothetical protein